MSRKVDMYLLHIEPPFSTHGKHYLGIVNDHRPIEERILEHRTGRGAKMCKLAVQAGCKLIVVRIWEQVAATRERALKRKGKSRYCHRCRPPKKPDWWEGTIITADHDLNALA